MMVSCSLDQTKEKAMLYIAKESPYVSGEMALFDDLVKAGEEKTHTSLPIDLRIFLVSCLVEHLYDSEIVHHVLAIDFLESGRTSGAVRMAALRRSGDASLILAGLFPERALRLHVNSNYFRQMGQSFYGSLAAHLEVGVSFEQGRFYNEVARGFEMLERVLLGARGKAQDGWGVYRRFRSQLN